MPQFPQFLEVEGAPGGGHCSFETLLCREGILVGCMSCCWVHSDHKQPCLSWLGVSPCSCSSQFPSYRPLTRLQQGPLSQQTL